MVRNQNVLRLQVPMVDSNGVTVGHGIQNLEESVFGKPVVSNVVALFSDVREQIAFWTEFDDNESAVRAVQDSYQGNNVWMLAGLVMECYLPSLEALLSGVQSVLGQSLHSVGDVGVDVDRLVDHAICANAEDRHQFKTVGQDTP